MDALFKENTENCIGTVRVDSGTLLITDGIFDSAGISTNSKQKVEFGDESVVVNIIAAMHKGRRYLLIPLDNVTAVKDIVPEQVSVEGLKEDEKETGVKDDTTKPNNNS